MLRLASNNRMVEVVPVPHMGLVYRDAVVIPYGMVVTPSSPITLIPSNHFDYYGYSQQQLLLTPPAPLVGGRVAAGATTTAAAAAATAVS